MDRTEGFRLLAMQATMLLIQRIYLRYSLTSAFVEKIELDSTENVEGRDKWSGKRFAMLITVLAPQGAGSTRKDLCRSVVSVYGRPEEENYTSISIEANCDGPAGSLALIGESDLRNPMEMTVATRFPEGLKITPDSKRLPLSLHEFPVSELEQRVNQHVQLPLKDWRLFEGRLNYYGPDATKPGDFFVAMDNGMSFSLSVSEIVQAWIVDRRP